MPEIFKLGWIGTVAFQAFTPEGRELVFDLAENQTLPEEFKQGDEVTIVNRPDWQAVHLAHLKINEGYYEVTHLKSGKNVYVLHKTSSWRFE